MPIRYESSLAIFEERCLPEEADVLLDWLRATPNASADLGTCAEMHTALLQLLLAARLPLRSLPSDPWLAACVAALPASVAVPDAGRKRGKASRRRGPSRADSTSQVSP